MWHETDLKAGKKGLSLNTSHHMSWRQEKKILHHGYSLIQKKLFGVDLHDYINL